MNEVQFLSPARRPAGLRYEIKMACDEMALPTTRSWVRLHSAGFREAFPARQVNNLYFDTNGLDTFNDHIESVPERRKLRFRWYGLETEQVAGQFEVKNKRERIGWKLIQPLNRRFDFSTLDWACLYREMVNEIQTAPNPLFVELLRVSRPFILNSYTREYYLSADGRVRLTLDYHLKVFDQWKAARPNFRFALPMAANMVIEFKCSPEDSRYLADVLAEFPLRTERNSKYVNGLDSLLER